MALRSALVDRARAVSREPTAEKVEGTTTYQSVEGPWFECRLAVGGPTQEQVNEGRVRTDQTPEFLYWRTAEDGSSVDLAADDTIEVVSNQEGNSLWRISSKPLDIRKKVVMLGAGYCNVERVSEPNEPDTW
jgi:hypothetical protein